MRHLRICGPSAWQTELYDGKLQTASLPNAKKKCRFYRPLSQRVFGVGTIHVCSSGRINAWNSRFSIKACRSLPRGYSYIYIRQRYISAQRIWRQSVDVFYVRDKTAVRSFDRDNDAHLKLLSFLPSFHIPPGAALSSYMKKAAALFFCAKNGIKKIIFYTRIL